MTIDIDKILEFFLELTLGLLASYVSWFLF
jgi:hypothetical protein